MFTYVFIIYMQQLKWANYVTIWSVASQVYMGSSSPVYEPFGLKKSMEKTHAPCIRYSRYWAYLIDISRKELWTNFFPGSAFKKAQ